MTGSLSMIWLDKAVNQGHGNQIFTRITHKTSW